MKKEILNYGIIVFPIVTIYGLFFNLFSGGKINFLIWIIMPSLFIEKILEKISLELAESVIFNTLFVIILWFLIGLIIGLLINSFERLFSANNN
ncbi:MAG TPA: hypothetical protein VKN74_07870 [Candidatus Mcinerneyibacterium sp.]|nr:hypothetical protein [Candidatus Mcinerneyibacterium sp.]